MKTFLGRLYRNMMVIEISSNQKTKGIVAGRVIGILDGEGMIPEFNNRENGYILQDDSGRIVVLSDDLPNIGDIIKVMVEKLSVGIQQVGEWQILVNCTDFFITSSSPNFLKMIVDENLKEKLQNRALIINEIRSFFLGRGFLEIDTPELVKYPGQEPYLDLFKTQFLGCYEGKKIEDDLYLISSPEYALKKYLVGGFEKIFQIGKAFRNKESFSERHNPEFTLLEWYRAYASYLDIMDDTEELVKYLFKIFNRGNEVLKYHGKEINMIVKWDRISVTDVFKKYAGVQMPENDQEKFFEIFLNQIEPQLGMEKPVIIFDYPISMAALSKTSEANPKFAERFEVYISGMELCNAFSELNDPIEQQKRLEEEKILRQKIGKDTYDIDPKFIAALQIGMPPAGGNALGVDRLIMLLLGENNIENILPIPYRDL